MGWRDLGRTPRHVKRIAAAANAKLAAAGYRVVENDSALPNVLEDAIKDPDARVVMEFGHGGTDPTGAYVAAVNMIYNAVRMDSWFHEYELPQMPVATYPLQQLHFHACGQSLELWTRHLQPGGSLIAWPAGATAGAIDAYINKTWTVPTPPVLGASAPSSRAAFDASSVPPPSVDPSLQSRCDVPSVSEIVRHIATPFDPHFQMGPSLATAFGSQTFNVYVSDDMQPPSQWPNPALILGEHVEAGLVTDWEGGTSGGGLPSPDFTVAIPYSDFAAALTHPATIASAYSGGRILVTIINPKGASSQTLFDGFAAVYFGIGASDVTDCSGLLASTPSLSGWGVGLLIVLLAVTSSIVQIRRNQRKPGPGAV